jgi:hypothetical protein
MRVIVTLTEDYLPQYYLVERGIDVPEERGILASKSYPNKRKVGEKLLRLKPSNNYGRLNQGFVLFQDNDWRRGAKFEHDEKYLSFFNAFVGNELPGHGSDKHQ